ncbi:dipeptide ABC transporter ATP-binding protein [Salinactinospora qingdaonensis]|uniref:Dipeptide ABC transporter ATP-binding protein n=1 Tax=Salinactinospora qingdaonensis TaxID=702744 RepID=A0ABP7FAU2_9ACTN
MTLDDVHVAFSPQGLFRRRTAPVRAVRGVSLGVGEAESVGLVGESGCGKSTLGRVAVRLLSPTSGTVSFQGQAIQALPERRMRPLRPGLQMVFQDPYSSLDPSMTVGDSVAEPLRVHERLSGAERRARGREMLHLVGLEERHLDRYPHEFSGGQRQRVALARALILNPQVVVCDEATSAVDVSTQNQILALLRELRHDRGMGFLFISHNLAAVRHVAQRVAVMYLGKVVETGPTARVFAAPAHPYTHMLLTSAPGASRRGAGGATPVGEPPSPVNPPAGCPFQTRCPMVMERCRVEMPAPTPVDGGGEVACHLQTDGPHLAGRPLPETLRAGV